MPTAADVAKHIIDKLGPVTSMKLQKLVYYSQAWATVWLDDKIFDEPVEAWENGPVVRGLWESNRGQFRISNIEGATGELSDAHKDTIERVLKFYGGMDAQWLSDLTHLEAPWKDAIASGRNSEITPEAMSKYYAALPVSDAAATE